MRDDELFNDMFDRAKSVADDTEEDESNPALSLSEAQWAVFVVKHYGLNRALLSKSLNTGLCALQRSLRKKRIIRKNS